MSEIYGQLKDVNTTDIHDAIRLGCKTMQSVFNADDGDIPFFGSSVRPHAELRFSGAHSESHIPGRHLNALLNAENAIGISLDESAVRKHAEAAFFSFSGNLPVPLNRKRLDGPLVYFRTHNLREGMHALHALVAYRHDERAHDLAEKCIASIFELWSPDRGWDTIACKHRYGLEPDERTLVSGLARIIGPLVKYYRTTKSPAALDLSIVLKERLLRDTFVEDGSYDRDIHGTHTHSTTCVMSSLAQLAELSNDLALLKRVQAFYDNGLMRISDPLGWVIENSADQQEDGRLDRGEINNTGDIVETALILGRFGYTEYYEDAERILRCHLLPSQLRDIDFIVEPKNPDGVDGLRDVANRHRGAFGFPAPYGHEPVDARDVSFNMDIVGGGVGTLCEAYRSTTCLDETGHHVNLLFDHETDAIKIESNYTYDTAAITLKQPGPLWIRIPTWADITRIASDIPGARITGHRLFIQDHPVHDRLEIPYDLSGRELILNHCSRDIRVKLRGDSVDTMDNFGADLTFFKPPCDQEQ
ncbi:MAG: hypothetical protein VX910_02525 [Candidatus Latescibacterota bacterium]|nr:hypothetical protein [Candidatus Latescibacterota bacterium]